MATHFLTTGIGAVTAAAASLYLIEITTRTSYFARTAAVGKDIVIMVVVTCLAGAVIPLLRLGAGGISRKLALVVSAVNVLLLLVYVVLIATGKFGPVAPGAS